MTNFIWLCQGYNRHTLPIHPPPKINDLAAIRRIPWPSLLFQMTFQTIPTLSFARRAVLGANSRPAHIVLGAASHIRLDRRRAARAGAHNRHAPIDLNGSHVAVLLRDR